MRPLKIRLFEEGTSDQAQDDGGVQQEFFRLAIAEALDPDSGMYIHEFYFWKHSNCDRLIYPGEEDENDLVPARIT